MESKILLYVNVATIKFMKSLWRIKFMESLWSLLRTDKT